MADLFNAYGWIPILAVLIVLWTIQALVSRRSTRARADALTTIAGICGQHGMSRVDDTAQLFVPQMLPVAQSRCQNSFATTDWSLWFSEVRYVKDTETFAALMFAAEGLNYPYVAVGRKGAVDLPLAGFGQSVGVESIDFTNRFGIRADDPRAAVMLVDLGMMQWLLDLDQVSFQISGPLVTAIVKERRAAKLSPADIDLLFRFQDGFAAHIPQLAFTEHPAPQGLAAATVQAMRMIPNLLSNPTRDVAMSIQERPKQDQGAE